MALRFPFSAPQEWVPQIGAIFLDPQVCRVLLKGLKTSVRLDKKGSAGRNGATITFQGKNLGSFSLEFASWNDEGTAVHERLIAVLKAAMDTGKPLAVYHPVLAAAGIDRMLVEDIGWPEFEGQLVTSSATCTEWAPPPKKPKVVTTTPKIADIPTAYTPPPGLPKIPKPPGPSAEKPKP